MVPIIDNLAMVAVAPDVGEVLWGMNVGSAYRSDYSVRWFGHPIVAFVAGGISKAITSPDV